MKPDSLTAVYQKIPENMIDVISKYQSGKYNQTNLFRMNYRNAIDSTRMMNHVPVAARANTESTKTGTKEPFKPIWKSPYDDKVEQYAKAANMDSKLLRAIITQESSFNYEAHNKGTDARGLMQITPIAEKDLKQKGYDVVNIYDPDENIKAGTMIYRDLLKKYDEIEMALFEYHQGAGNVANYIKNAGSKKWADVKRYTESKGYAKNGRHYVERIMGYYNIYKNQTM